MKSQRELEFIDSVYDKSWLLSRNERYGRSLGVEIVFQYLRQKHGGSKIYCTNPVILIPTGYLT